MLEFCELRCKHEIARPKCSILIRPSTIPGRYAEAMKKLAWEAAGLTAKRPLRNSL